MKKIALLTATILLLPQVACGRKPKTGATLTIDLSHSYTAERITLIDGDPWEQFEAQTRNGSILGATTDMVLLQYGVQIYSYNFLTGEGQPITFPYYEEHKDDIQTAEFSKPIFTPDGGMMLIYHFRDENGNVIYDIPHYMEKYNSKLELVESYELPEEFSKNQTVDLCAADSDGYLYVYEYGENDIPYFCVYDAEFHEIGKIDSPDSPNIFSAADGHVYINYWEYGTAHIGRIDRENYKIEELNISTSNEAIYEKGNSNYLFIKNSSDGLYGFQSDGTSELLVDWTASDMDPYLVDTPILLPDGKIIVNEHKNMTVSNSTITYSDQWLLRKRTVEEIANTTVLSLAAVSSQVNSLSTLVTQFNRQSPDTRIVLYNYNQFNTEDDKTLGLTKMKSDMTNGILADIVCTDGLDVISFYQKGLFEDLSDRLNNDKEITENTYYMNFFDALRYGKVLPEIGFSFQLSTLVAKQEYVGNASGITMAEWIALTKNMPEGMTIFYDMTQESVLQNLCTSHLNSFVDLENNTCHFDSPEFLQILEIAAGCPTNDSDRFMNMSATEISAYVTGLNTAFRNDKALFSSELITSPYDWHSIREGTFNNAPISIVGWPNGGSGNGAIFIPDYKLAINAQSLYADEAWEFFKYLLSEDMQNSLSNSLPVCRSVMEKRIQEAINPPLDAFGKSVVHSWLIGSTAITLQNATQEEMDEYLAYVEQTVTAAYQNETIANIVAEEAGMYFAGDCTSESAAKNIQSRVSLYLEEQS